ncbi:hypothetical protein ACFSHT_14940 [Paraburkholderia silviterrae]|uniref:Uncharacterized protein n=1 Tax=Paraburkholderia silviterrae TaxID=2528715 RepID=A0A4R5M9U6_9BURK|nr:hypothetical protein [Paraburkholderia silviterrae]TDG23389.1 hypothetical protein EYW47_15865 [Paraburkholderia silviterrae]
MREKGEVAARLIDVMQEGTCGTATELAMRVKADARSVRAVLRLWLEAGIVHVAEEIVPGRARVFRYGSTSSPPAGLAGAMPHKPRRGPAVPVDRWPQLDSDLAAAVDAMVRVRVREPVRAR